MPFSHWIPRLRSSELPAYQLIPELLSEDLRNGRLAPRERLPPLLERTDGVVHRRGFPMAQEHDGNPDGHDDEDDEDLS